MSATASIQDWVCVLCLVPFRLAIEQPWDETLACPLCGEKTARPYLSGGKGAIYLQTFTLRSAEASPEMLEFSIRKGAGR